MRGLAILVMVFVDQLAGVGGVPARLTDCGGLVCEPSLTLPGVVTRVVFFARPDGRAPLRRFGQAAALIVACVVAGALHVGLPDALAHGVADMGVRAVFVLSVLGATALVTCKVRLQL